MAEANELNTYVFTKAAVLRAIDALEQNPIHEHFPGYLAILRALRANPSGSARLADINEFHDLYLRVVDAPDQAPYVRPFKSRGRGLELFNANVAGSYAPSSLRAKGKLIDVIDVHGERQNTTYSLKQDHASHALAGLLKGNKVPVTSLAAFLYRDFGFLLEAPNISSIVNLFRQEFGLEKDQPSKNRVFETLFEDDTAYFDINDLEFLAK